MSRITFLLISSVMAVLFVLSSCEHRPLVELNEIHYVRIYLDEHLRNVNFGFYDETKEKPEYKTPEVMRVALFDPSDGSLQSERYIREVGHDEKGTYIHGYISAKPGTYNLVAYNFDTGTLKVRNDRWYTGMEAYTTVVSDNIREKLESARSSKDDEEAEEIAPAQEIKEEILYEPEHFFVNTSEWVNVELTDKADTLKTAEGEDFVATSLVKTYYMQVNVKGVEYATSASALITGMAGSVTVYNGEHNRDNPASIYFTMKNDAVVRRNSDGVATAYANFNTFGKLKDVEGYIYITFQFNTVWGTVQTETIRVTDMFETPQVKEQQWIIIDKVIEIVPPEEGSGGATSPGVNDWNEVQGDITI
jgi:hypothetical protein